MNEQQVRQIAEQVYASKEATAVYSSFQTDSHEHNGVDAPKISQKNLVQSSKYQVRGVIPSSGTTNFTGVSNPSSISFYGYALGPGGVALLNGVAYFGPCYISLSTNLSSTNSIQKDVIQGSNGLTLDPTFSSPPNATVGDKFLFAQNSGGTNVVVSTITAFDSQSITIQTVLAAGWTIVGEFFIV